MIYLFAAMHHEAAGLIRRLDLRKTADARRFPQFRAEDSRILLTLTGSGPVAAAAAVSSVFTACPPGAGDMVVSYGSCGAAGLEAGCTYRAAALYDTDARRAYYPDILLTSPFPSAIVHTAAAVWTGADDSRSAAQESAAALGVRPLPALHDMEASAVYRAALYYVGPHQLIFLKTVTDSGVPECAAAEPGAFKETMDNAADDIAEYVMQLAEMFGGGAGSGAEKTGPEKACAEKTGAEKTGAEKAGARNASAEKALAEAAAVTERLAEAMHCSATMRAELAQTVKYLYLTGVGVSAKADAMFESGMLPAKDRQEGKKLLEQFKNEFI